MAGSETWTEKYRPTSLDEYRGSTKKVDEIQKWIKNWHNRSSQALLLHGPAGSGKTSLVEAIANEQGLDLFETNASDVRTKDSLQDKLEQAVKQRSFTGKKKLILIDEIDGMTSKDRGGTAYIETIIDESRFPVVVTANDPYANGMASIRRKAKVLEMGGVHTNSIAALLRDIAQEEEIEYEDAAIKSIARRSDGDIRSAINDLQSLSQRYETIDTDAIKDLGYRDTEKDIFEALKILFKTTTAETASDATDDLDEDYDEIFEWIRENVPREYQKDHEIAAAMDALSEADLYRGRIRKGQNWTLLKYVYELMSVGVALSKDEKYSGFTRYQYPSRIKKMGQSKAKRKKRDDIGAKISEQLHVSIEEARTIIPFLQVLFEREQWRKNIIDHLDLTEDEIEYIETF
ncbi:MAG: replication factor C large subunit [Candidatus Nanohaloarchaeota archaeon QJJ-5]|nr:replication factor C large subunit [Candidatus Nanohaloarchaeota archaeon QJJ-5]